jgi:hypothetical protein
MKSAMIITIACCMLVLHVLALDSEALQDRTDESPLEIIDDEKTVSQVTAESVRDGAMKAREMIEAGRFEEAIVLLAPYTSDPLKHANEVSDYIVLLTWQGKSSIS